MSQDPQDPVPEKVLTPAAQRALAPEKYVYTSNLLVQRRVHALPSRQGRRHGGRVKVVRGHHAAAGQLLDMAMAVDAAGQDQAIGGVDVACAGWKGVRNGSNAAVANADVGVQRRPHDFSDAADADRGIRQGQGRRRFEPRPASRVRA